jgi:phenylpyruvate tautomerase PptA (4-oxalocrotonate tautomerase family)
MREILLNISLVAIAAALFRMLVPENSFKKQISFLVACFFIMSVVSLVSGVEINLSEIEGVEFAPETKFIDFSEQTTAQRKRAIGEELSERVRDILNENGFYPSKIYVIVNISGLYSISINEIRLVLPPDSDFVKASALVEKEVGKGISVIFIPE